MGSIASIIPSSVFIPLPPLNLAKIGYICPSIDVIPAVGIEPIIYAIISVAYFIRQK